MASWAPNWPYLTLRGLGVVDTFISTFIVEIKPIFLLLYLIYNFYIYYKNLGTIFLMVWRLFAFRDCSNFGNFQQFFHRNFPLKWKFVILMVSSERSSYIYQNIFYFILKNIFFIHKNPLLGEKFKYLKHLFPFSKYKFRLFDK